MIPQHWSLLFWIEAIDPLPIIQLRVEEGGRKPASCGKPNHTVARCWELHFKPDDLPDVHGKDKGKKPAYVAVEKPTIPPGSCRKANYSTGGLWSKHRLHRTHYAFISTYGALSYFRYVLPQAGSTLGGLCLITLWKFHSLFFYLCLRSSTSNVLISSLGQAYTNDQVDLPPSVLAAFILTVNNSKANTSSFTAGSVR